MWTNHRVVMLKSKNFQGRRTRSFTKIVYVKYKTEEFIYLLDVMTSVYKKGNTNQPNCNAQ